MTFEQLFKLRKSELVNILKDVFKDSQEALTVIETVCQCEHIEYSSSRTFQSQSITMKCYGMGKVVITPEIVQFTKSNNKVFNFFFDNVFENYTIKNNTDSTK